MRIPSIGFMDNIDHPINIVNTQTDLKLYKHVSVTLDIHIFMKYAILITLFWNSRIATRGSVSNANTCNKI